MNALDVYTKINIKDYLAIPEAKLDKEYSEERQKIRHYIRKDDLPPKLDVGVIDWANLITDDGIIFDMIGIVPIKCNPTRI